MAHRLPPCTWTFLSGLGKEEFFSSLLCEAEVSKGRPGDL
jgi:hypothetical protein